MNRIFILILAMVILLYSGSNAPTLIPMTDTNTYDFLEYLNISAVIDIEFTGMKPYRSNEIYKKTS